MNLTEASALAVEIESDERFAVIAIGRFRMTSELIANAPDRWGVSVIARDPDEYRGVLWDRDAWIEFRDVWISGKAFLENASSPQSAPSDPPTAKPRNRDDRHRAQPTLF